MGCEPLHVRWTSVGRTARCYKIFKFLLFLVQTFVIRACQSKLSSFWFKVLVEVSVLDSFSSKLLDRVSGGSFRSEFWSKFLVREVWSEFCSKFWSFDLFASYVTSKWFSGPQLINWTDESSRVSGCKLGNAMTSMTAYPTRSWTRCLNYKLGTLWVSITFWSSKFEPISLIYLTKNILSSKLFSNPDNQDTLPSVL